MKAKLKIKKGDTVEVIAGSRKDKGKRGEVLRVLPKENRIVVQGIAVRKKHKKAQPTAQGGRAGAPQIVEFEAPISVSNVMLVDPKTGELTRVGYKLEGEKWVRVAKASGEILDK
jgi:large subunit ribosomal protein L24